MSISLRGMYWTGAYFPSRSVSASRVLATTRPATDTITHVGLGSIVIGWSGPGSLMVFVGMALSGYPLRSFELLDVMARLLAQAWILIFIRLLQLWHEHQPADPEAVQLALAFGQDRCARTHMAGNDGAQLRIVRAHELCDPSEFGRIAGQSEDCQIGLVNRSIDRKISDQRGMSVVEDGEAILERDEERCRRPAVGTGRKRIVMGARADFEFNAFHDKLIADTGSPELLLLQSLLGDQPAPQRTGCQNRCTGQRRDFRWISH